MWSCMSSISSIFGTSWSSRKSGFSSFSNQKLKGLKEGEYVVELNDFGGLGFCASEEEIEVLYEMLTKETIYK